VTEHDRLFTVPRNRACVYQDPNGVTMFSIDDQLEVRIVSSSMHQPESSAQDHRQPEATRASNAALDLVWARMQRDHPRLFDGPILAVVDLDHGRTRLTLRLDSYKRLAAQTLSGIDTGVEQASITGMLVTHDAQGRDRVLLARRSLQTRIYGGMWEIGPSGGVDPPNEPLSKGDLALSREMILGQLHTEMEEELGESPVVESIEFIGLCRDPHAHSLDIVALVRCQSPSENAALVDQHMDNVKHDHWEYSETCWAKRADLESWDHAQRPMIPTTLATLRWLGWIK
jgi:hypothetical protein